MAGGARGSRPTDRVKDHTLVSGGLTVIWGFPTADVTVRRGLTGGRYCEPYG